MKKNKVCGYVRVSTENQLENYSIEEQTQRIKAYCIAKDFLLTKVYTDGGYSGGNTNRPALQLMLSDIHKNLVDTVIVYKLDRLSRSQKDTLTLIEDEFFSNNIDFISINENFDTSTPFGRAMIGILSVFAQLEKDQITERFTMGRIGRAKGGFYHGGPMAPTGYDYVNGKLLVNEYEALQIKEVYKRFLEGQSIHAIQKYMSENYTNKYGNWSSHTLVSNILKNEVYIGKVKFMKESYNGIHEPIISNVDFQKVQLLLNNSERKEKNAYSKTPFKAKYLLSGILFCQKCGAKYFGNHGKYSCYSRAKTNRDKIIDPNCRNKNWYIEELDNYVKNAVSELDFNSEYINKLINTKSSKAKSNKEETLNHVSELEKQIIRMLDLYQLGILPKEQISDTVTKLKARKDSLQSQLIIEEQTKPQRKEAFVIVDVVKDILTNGDMSLQRLFIRALIDHIEIAGDNVEIYWAFN